ncbi:MAG: hypothetical protein WDM85_12080 [Caulobacteraceae bacterium]
MSRAQIETTINAVNAEDALKYLPDVLIRKRHIGDTPGPARDPHPPASAPARAA